MVTVCYSRLPIGHSGLQLATASYRVVTVGRLEQVTEWLQLVTAGYSRLQQVTERLQWVTQGYSKYGMVTVGYNRLQQGTEWLQWVTAGYSKLPSGYSG